MPDNPITDAVEQAKGRVKEAAGVLAGDEDLEQQGQAQQEKVEKQQEAEQKAAEAQAAQAEASKAEAEQRRAQHG